MLGLKNRAFSLLELIITIAILSIGIVVVLQALSFCARVTGISCDIVNAVFLAKDKMQELEFKEKQKLIENGPKEEKAREGKFEWDYSLNLDAALSLYELNFNIRWQRANRQDSLSLNTYLRQ